MPKKTKRIPWQHMPENRDKALAQAANARKAKQAKGNSFASFIEKKATKTKVIDYGNHLSEQLKTLTDNAKARVKEIAEEINTLEKERRNLISAFNLRDMATVNNIEEERR